MFFVLVILLSGNLLSQGLNIGIRGGVNFSTFSAELDSEVSEKYSLNNGFHFGIEAVYSLNRSFGIGTELLYNQIGTKYKYKGPGYYIFYRDQMYILKNDKVSYDLNISNSYLFLPVNLMIRPVPQLEFKVGAYLGFLIFPTANGTMEFGNKFNKRLRYNYYSDKKPLNPYFENQGIDLNIITENEDGTQTIRRTKQIARAYDQYPSDDIKKGSLYRVVDTGLNIGLNYFINKSLLVGVTFQYGLRDITNNKLDRSLKELDDDGDLFFNNDDKLIYRDKFDRNINFQLSLGFRF
jgi:hypothetical protein